MIDWKRADLRDFLCTAWAAGHSTRHIADMMAERFKLRVTKNAIVGSAHRLGLPSRPSPIRYIAGVPTPRKPRAAQPAGPVTLPPLLSVDIPSAPLHKSEQATHKLRLVDLRGTSAIPPLVASMPAASAPPVAHCQYPLNDARPWQFCDQPATVKLNPETGRVICAVYCARHFRLCYQVGTGKSDLRSFKTFALRRLG